MAPCLGPLPIITLAHNPRASHENAIFHDAVLSLHDWRYRAVQRTGTPGAFHLDWRAVWVSIAGGGDGMVSGSANPALSGGLASERTAGGPSRELEF
jgi:hypothetical protein